MSRPLVLALALFATWSVPAAAETAADPQPKVDGYVRAQLEQLNVPGASVAVVRDGKVVLATGYGLANVEHSAPASADSVYQLASVTKQFTAAAVMLLVEDGKIALDDPISKHLAGLPESWNAATVRHLLTHTSGIPSYTSQPGWEKKTRTDLTQAEVLATVSSLPLDFQPGEKWAYDNTGYFLLGMLIERAGGKPYGEFLRERIFKPLGMTSTRLNSLQEVIKNRATGYSLRGGKLVNGEYVSPTQPFSAGALISSGNDMAKWAQALEGETLLKKASLEQMWASGTLKDGSPVGYGFGWQLNTREGHPVVQHGGGIQGFSTEIARFPNDRLTVIVLTNRDGGHAEALANGIAGIYVPALDPSQRKAIEDRDPDTTARLRKLFDGVVEGKPDLDQLTPEFRKFLTPERVQQAHDSLSRLGAVQTFELLAEQVENGSRTRRYRVVLARGKVRALFTLAKDGKVAAAGFGSE